jgi:hypothetical protein
MGRKNLLVANSFIDSASPEFNEAPNKPISLHSGETVSEEGRIANSE